MTPTQIEGHNRHKAFHAHIARVAVPDCVAEKAVSKVAPVKTLQPESFPAKSDPPETLLPISNDEFREAAKFAEEITRGFSDVIRIIRAVSAHTGISIPEIKSERRTYRVVRPRQYVYYLSKKLTMSSLPAIGRQLGGKDHTSVIAGIRKMEQLRQIDPKIESDLQAIATSLGGSLA